MSENKFSRKTEQIDFQTQKSQIQDFHGNRLSRFQKSQYIYLCVCMCIHSIISDFSRLKINETWSFGLYSDEYFFFQIRSNRKGVQLGGAQKDLIRLRLSLRFSSLFCVEVVFTSWLKRLVRYNSYTSINRKKKKKWLSLFQRYVPR